MCVLGRGQGGCAGTTSHTAAHIKRLRLGGEELGRPSLCPPPFPGERAFPLAFWRRGLGGGVLVILTRSWKINRFPIKLWQLLPHPSSSSEWG